VIVNRKATWNTEWGNFTNDRALVSGCLADGNASDSIRTGGPR
jgi:hypothetical protein